MPGAPQMRAGKPIAERSALQIVVLFLVLPILAGGGILCFTLINAVDRGREFTAGDWFWQVGWIGLLGLGVMSALPAAGWQELRRRRNRPLTPQNPEQHFPRT
jgi:membrane protein implicated in regulation of membrane protease activity